MGPAIRFYSVFIDTNTDRLPCLRCKYTRSTRQPSTGRGHKQPTTSFFSDLYCFAHKLSTTTSNWSSICSANNYYFAFVIRLHPPAITPLPAQHPICQRHTEGTIIRPSDHIQRSDPVTRSMKSWSDMMKKADDDIHGDATPSTPRSRGRPPRNHEWDSEKRAYVPINIIRSPNVNKAWVLAAINSELVSDHPTPTTYE